jgi:hypothetical protein
MFDYAVNAFAELYKEHFRAPANVNKTRSILHIGADGLQDYKVIRELLDFENINEKPQSVKEFYEFLGYEDIDVVNINDIDEWSTSGKCYDFIFNCHSSDRILDQIKFMEAVENISKEKSYILHVVPYNSVFEHGYYSYNPIFFYHIKNHFMYDIIQSTIGSLEARHIQNLNIVDEFSSDRYSIRYHIKNRFTPDHGWLGPIFISVAYYKDRTNVQEDD